MGGKALSRACRLSFDLRLLAPCVFVKFEREDFQGVCFQFARINQLFQCAVQTALQRVFALTHTDTNTDAEVFHLVNCRAFELKARTIFFAQEF